MPAAANRNTADRNPELMTNPSTAANPNTDPAPPNPVR